MKEQLTGRQRVKNAIERKEVDRYPIDLGMHFSTGISVFAYYNLRKYLGLSVDNIQLADTVQMLARVDDDIIERFHIDTVLLNPLFRNVKKWNIRDNYEFWTPQQMNYRLNSNGEYIVTRGNESMRMPQGGYFFDGSWLQMEDEVGENLMKLFGEQSNRVFHESDKFTCLMGQFVAFFNGIDQACDMLTDPDVVIAQQNKLYIDQVTKLDQFIKYGGKNVDCIELNSDLGMQSAPMLSPDCYEEFVYPYVKRFVSYIHDNTNAKVFLHSCGSIEPLIPLIIDAGIDCLNPVQISAKNMEPQHLKDKYGKQICFWGGGCNTQQILAFKGVDEVRHNTKMLTDIFKKDSGFVFNQVHNIMGDVPPENIVAMLETAYNNSFYKIGEKK